MSYFNWCLFFAVIAVLVGATWQIMLEANDAASDAAATLSSLGSAGLGHGGWVDLPGGS